MNHPLPDWVPEEARLYVEHVIQGTPIRTLARRSQSHASTVLRRVRRCEGLRDDPLIDLALSRLERGQKGAIALDASTRIACQNGVPTMKMTKIEPAPCQDLVASEARRVLRRLSEPNACLAVAAGMEKSVIIRETPDGQTLRIGVVDTAVAEAVAEAMALKNWIGATGAGRVVRYRIRPAGRLALKDLMAEEETEATPARDPRGMRYGSPESPLTVLAQRRDRDGQPFLSPDLVRAGERLREDFELSEMAEDGDGIWAALMDAPEAPAVAADAVLAPGRAAARDRVRAAVQELGPGLGDVVLRSCCKLEGMESVEKRMGWAARSGKIVLRIALQRLERHYRDTMGDYGPLIGWNDGRDGRNPAPATGPLPHVPTIRYAGCMDMFGTDIETQTDGAERGRRALLQSYGLHDGIDSSPFDEIVRLTARLSGKSVAFISLFDTDSQWFLSRHGIDALRVPLEASICHRVISRSEVTVIEDTHRDARLVDNQFCRDSDGYRFYAGAPLTAEDGRVIGALAVMDFAPGRMDPPEVETLSILSRQVMAQLDLRRTLRRTDILRREVDHRVKNSLQSVASLTRLQSRAAALPETREALESVSRRINTVAELNRQLYLSTDATSVALHPFLSSVVTLVQDSLHGAVDIDFGCDDVRIGTGQAGALAIVVNEFSTNSAKHAFDPGVVGQVVISVRRMGRDHLRLVCRDDGRGLREVAPGTGLGMTIMQGAVDQLAGTRQDLPGPGPGPGYGFAVVFPR